MGSPVDSSGPRKPLIVCVDDDPEILRSIKRLFRNEPYEVLLTEYPAQVLQWICDRRVDLLIADQRMPEMNGSDLLEVVQDYSPETACMILSGFPDTALIVEEAQLRIEHLITKPWDNAQLVETIRRVLKEPTDKGTETSPASTPSRPGAESLMKPLEVIADCGGRTARDVTAQILQACSHARAQGIRAVIVLKNLSLLRDSISRLLKGLARAVAWSHLPIDLCDESGCVAAFVVALGRPTPVQ
jgi:CheY-like chemotaxis protein